MENVPTDSTEVLNERVQEKTTKSGGFQCTTRAACAAEESGYNFFLTSSNPSHTILMNVADANHLT